MTAAPAMTNRNIPILRLVNSMMLGGSPLSVGSGASDNVAMQGCVSGLDAAQFHITGAG